MKKLLSILLALLLLCGCAATYDGPTESRSVLTEHTADHYYAYFDETSVHYTNRYVFAYDIYGNQVRHMEYRADELQTVTNSRYDEQGNQISSTRWDHSGWFPKFSSRTERTYDGQGRVLSYESFDFWGRLVSGSYYSYDDENGIRTRRDENGEVLQTAWYDDRGLDIRETAGEYETVYEYDDRGNCTGWVTYKNGQLYDRYEARYDDRDRQIHAARYDANENRTSRKEYIFDDEAHTMTCAQSDGGKRIEYYYPDGRPSLIEDYNQDGSLSMVQRYYYRDIQVPKKEE